MDKKELEKEFKAIKRQARRLNAAYREECKLKAGSPSA